MPSPTKTRYRLETAQTVLGLQQPLHRLTDEQAGIRASVAPFSGAELASLQVRRNGEWVEMLDRAEDFRPCDRWRGRAPWLWPAVGRNYAPDKLKRAIAAGTAIPDCEWEYSGQVLPMPLHGFAMSRPWQLVETKITGEGATVECALRDDSETRRCYPFGFVIRLSVSIADGILGARLRIVAGHGNERAMPFCVGNHLSLRMPISTRDNFGHVRVFAPVRRVYRVTPLGLAGELEELNFREGIPLGDRRLHDLIVGHFAPEQAAVRVVDPCGVEVEIAHRELVASRAMAPENGYYFVFYGLPEHGVFCPEPWVGLPNALNTHRGAVLLEPGACFQWEMTIRIVPAGRASV